MKTKNHSSVFKILSIPFKTKSKPTRFKPKKPRKTRRLIWAATAKSNTKSTKPKSGQKWPKLIFRLFEPDQSKESL